MCTPYGENMKKTLEKIFILASVVVAVILIMVLVVTAFGGIKSEDFDNNLVKGLLFTLSLLYLALSIITIVLAFINTDAIKDVTLHTDKGGSIKVSVGVVSKYVKKACAQVEGVKCKKVDLVSDEYGVRLKACIKVVDKDVVEVETYIRILLEDMFLHEFNFTFSSIELKVTALVPKYEANQAEIEAAVEKKLEERRAKAEEEKAEEEKEEAEKTEIIEQLEHAENVEEVAENEETENGAQEAEPSAEEVEEAPVEEAVEQEAEQDAPQEVEFANEEAALSEDAPVEAAEEPVEEKEEI